jgi:hypothetical protein
MEAGRRTDELEPPMDDETLALSFFLSDADMFQPRGCDTPSSVRIRRDYG